MNLINPELSPILDVRGITKHFPVGVFYHARQVHAVEDVSFTVQRGQVVALVGESGSGKTTTIRMIARLIPVTQGQIFFKGQDILKTEPRQASLEYRRKVQLIFQDPFASLNAVHTIEHHLARPLIIHGKPPGGRRSTIGFAICWKPWNSNPLQRLPIAIRTSSPVGSASAWPSHAPWPSTRS